MFLIVVISHLLAFRYGQSAEPDPLLGIQIARLPEHALDAARTPDELVDGDLADDLRAVILPELGQREALRRDLGFEGLGEGQGRRPSRRRRRRRRRREEGGRGGGGGGGCDRGNDDGGGGGLAGQGPGGDPADEEGGVRHHRRRLCLEMMMMGMDDDDGDGWMMIFFGF